MNKTITLLGLDPSLSNTGYAIAEVSLNPIAINRVIKVGLVETKPGQEGKKVRKSSEDVARARQTADTLKVEIAEHNIKIATGEVPFGAQSARAALSNGVCVGILASLSVPLIEVSPNEVKLASAGTKTADKEDIVRWAVQLAPGVDWPRTKRANDWDIKAPDGLFVVKKAEHPADAVGAIAACIRTPEFQKLAGMLLSLA